MPNNEPFIDWKKRCLEVEKDRDFCLNQIKQFLSGIAGIKQNIFIIEAAMHKQTNFEGGQKNGK